MKTSDLVKELCDRQNITIAELSRRIGQSPQNLGKKIQRDTLTLQELHDIADATGAVFEQDFLLPDGSRIAETAGE